MGVLFKVVELHEENLDLGALQCIHIGCDEVWCLGQGVETRSEIHSKGSSGLLNLSLNT